MSLTERARSLTGRGRKKQETLESALATAEIAEKPPVIAEQEAVVVRQDIEREVQLRPYEDGMPFDLGRVTKRIQVAGVTILEEMVTIGKYLIWAKEEIGHGAFLSWLEKDVGMSHQRASEFMRVAQRVIESKVPPVRHFLREASGQSKKKLMALMDVSDEEIAEVMETKTFLGRSLDEVEAMSVRELREALRVEKQRNEVQNEKNRDLEKKLANTKADLQRARNPDEVAAEDPPTLLDKKFLQASAVLGQLTRIAAEYADEFGDEALMEPPLRDAIDSHIHTMHLHLVDINRLLVPDQIADARYHIQPRPTEEA